MTIVSYFDLSYVLMEHKEVESYIQNSQALLSISFITFYMYSWKNPQNFNDESLRHSGGGSSGPTCSRENYPLNDDAKVLWNLHRQSHK